MLPRSKGAQLCGAFGCLALDWMLSYATPSTGVYWQPFVAISTSGRGALRGSLQCHFVCRNRGCQRRMLWPTRFTRLAAGSAAVMW